MTWSPRGKIPALEVTIETADCVLDRLVVVRINPRNPAVVDHVSNYANARAQGKDRFPGRNVVGKFRRQEDPIFQIGFDQNAQGCGGDVSQALFVSKSSFAMYNA